MIVKTLRFIVVEQPGLPSSLLFSHNLTDFSHSQDLPKQLSGALVAMLLLSSKMGQVGSQNSFD